MVDKKEKKDYIVILNMFDVAYKAIDNRPILLSNTMQNIGSLKSGIVDALNFDTILGVSISILLNHGHTGLTTEIAKKEVNLTAQIRADKSTVDTIIKKFVTRYKPAKYHLTIIKIENGEKPDLESQVGELGEKGYNITIYDKLYKKSGQ